MVIHVAAFFGKDKIEEVLSEKGWKKYQHGKCLCVIESSDNSYRSIWMIHQ